MVNNILYVFGGEIASGAEIVMERLIANNKFQSHLFIAPGTFADSLKAKPYKINVVNTLKKLNRSSASAIVFFMRALYNYVAVSYKTYTYIKKNKINIVHCNTIGPASYLLPLIVLSPLLCRNVKWVWTDHDIKYYFALDHLLSKVCVNFFDITLVVSNAVKYKYAGHPKVKVLYNGLNCQIFKPDEFARAIFRNNYGFDKQDIVIGIVGVIAPRKGQYQLIEAFKIINAAFKNTRLVLAGTFGEDHPQYGERVSEMINGNQIIYLGYVADTIVDLYNGCDIIVNNSNIEGSEPLGTTIYEAMACKKIVAVSNVGGNQEIVDDKVNGYVFEAENIDSIANTIQNIINNFEVQQTVRDSARNKAVEKFNIDVMSLTYARYLMA